MVGSNEITTPVIEDSYRRLLHLLDDHLKAGSYFLMGTRPGVGDFGIFGQLSQLAHFDPTPSAIAARETPRVVSWVSHMDDLVRTGNWRMDFARQACAELARVLTEIGRVYAPFLIANARALSAHAGRVECEIDGRPWIQQPFPYQAKCLKWLREGYAALASADRAFVDSYLAGTGADAIFTTAI